MRAQVLLALLPALGAHGIRIIQSNDDGWAELYARSFFNALTAAGHDVVLSAPAENKSGSSTR
jgi:broad specificity polyphosphatase/5'/3'-nucleotidase SurE